MNNSLAVIIPSKTSSNVEACVRAVREAGETCRIIVVDDGLEIFIVDDPELIYVDGIDPFVFARNINLGIKAAGCRDVILLNDDALLKSTGGFTLLQREARGNPDYGIIGAVTNITGQILQHPQAIGLREVPHLAFVCVLIPRRTIDQVGLLDERYALDYGVDDRDYCEMVRRAGLKVGVYDHCYVDHGSLLSSFRGDPHAARSFSKNLELFKQKWGYA